MSKQKAGKFPSTAKDSNTELKRFYLNRKEDASGTSGVGVVAIGAVCPSGRCFLEWTTVVKSIGIYNSIADIEAIHGHDGKTEIVWVD